MDYQLFPIFTTVFSIPILGVIILLQQNKDRPAVPSLMLLMISIIGWMIFNTLELVTPTEKATLFWGELTYLFISTTPAFWLLFILDYYNQRNWINRLRPFLLLAIPLMIMGLIFTNPWHHLIWKTVTFLPVGTFLALKVDHGPVFYVIWVYAQILILVGVILLLRENFNNNNLYRWRVSWLTTGALTVLVFSLIYISHVFPGWQKDYTPIALSIGSLCFFIAISKYQLLKIVPIGRTTLFEALDEGILIIDSENMVVNINIAALNLFMMDDRDVIGKTFSDAFPIFSVPELTNMHPRVDMDLCISENPLRYLNLKTRPVLDSFGHAHHYLITIRDVTEEKLTQAAEKDERIFAEALSQVAGALNSTRNLDELLDLIMANVVQVTSCDSANIMMIDGGYAHAVRSLEPLKAWVKLPIDTTRNLHWMIENRQPMVMPDVCDFPEWVKIPETHWIQSYVGAPIIAFEEVIGFINLDSATVNFYNQKTAARLLAFANQASIAIQNAQTFKKMEEMAHIDGLTNLYNRRYFYELAVREFDRAKRYERDLSAIMVDLDHFKKINDSYGHLIGDEVLRKVSEICTTQMRTTDIIGRYGGEEFVILLPETDLAGAEHLGERLCQQIASAEISNSSGKISVTGSLGVAYMEAPCKKLEDLLELCDQALYQAKKNGRNRVAVHSQDATI